jgi:carbamoyl-phosphate synthase large subunit
VTANSEFYASGLLAGDHRYVVPRIDDTGYLSSLLKIVEEQRIGLVLSLFDLDLPVLAAARARFQEMGAEVAVSGPDTIEIAGDKWRMFEFLRAHGIPTPRSWIDFDEALNAIASGDASFPLFVKPRWGMGSIGVRRADDPAGLQAAVREACEQVARTYLNLMAPERLGEAVLIQEFLTGEEYGADVFNDLEGRHLATAVKHKISQRPEGADFAFTVTDMELEGLCSQLSLLLRHRSNLDIDFIRPDDGTPQVLEINARFGGGYPFSHLAGARFPRALVQMVRGEEPDPGRVEAGVYGMLDILPRRFDPHSR